MTEAEKYLQDNNYFELSGRETEMSKLMMKFADEQVKKALEEVEKSLPSDEEIMSECQKVDADGTIYLDGCRLSATKNQRNKTQEVINKLRHE